MEFSGFFSVAAEAVPGKGEDSYTYGISGDIVYCAVFDGCGGIGGRCYPGKLGGHTGAWASARLLTGVLDEFARTQSAVQKDPAPALVRQMEEALRQLKARTAESDRLSGRLVRSFPSTAAILFLAPTAEGTAARICHAGDARCYFLDAEGLHQLTIDDVDADCDAFAALTEDARLTRTLNADEPLSLHSRLLQLRQPGLWFAASDGIFGYLHSPMELEYLLLHTMAQAQSPAQWTQQLTDLLQKRAGDDYTMTAAAIGYDSFSHMQATLRPRLEALTARFIQPAAHADRRTLQALWLRYKPAYEKYLRQDGE